MKKIIIALFSLIFLFVVAVLAAPFLIPKERVIAEVQKLVKEKTGRELTLKGDIDLSVWPSLSVVMKDVSFANASWGKPASMITLDSLDLKLDTRALLNKEIKVNHFILTKPVIFLEKNKAGKGNWEIEISSAESEKKVLKDKDTPSTKDKAAPMAVTLGDIKIVDGQVTYHDYKTNQKENLKNVNIDLSVVDLTSPLNLKGSIVYGSEKVDMDVYFDQMQALLDGKMVEHRSSIKLAGGSVDFKGQVALKETWKATGHLTTDIPDLKKIMSFAKVDQDVPINEIALDSDVDLSPSRMDFKGIKLKTEAFTAEGNANIALAKSWKMTGNLTTNVSDLKKLTGDVKDLPVNEVKLASKMTLSPEKMTFNKVELEVDGLDMTGDVSVYLNGARPNIKGALSLSKLNIDKYLPASSASNTGAVSPSKTSNKSSGWDDTPIDFSGLKTIDADLKLKTNGVHYQGLELGANTVKLKMDNGKLNLSLSDTKVFEGQVRGDVMVDASASVPTIKTNLTLGGVQAKQALTHFADFKKLTGTAESQINLTMRGDSQKKMVDTLNGKGFVIFRDGALEGLDLARWAKMLQSRMSSMELGQGKTEFVEMGGSFTVVNGIASNSDLKLIGPLVSSTGSGTADLPKQYLKYRLIPELSVTSSKEIANAETGELEMISTKSSLAIPIDVKGAFSNLKIKPDYGSLIKDVLKDPKKIKQNLKTIESQVKDIGRAMDDDKGKAVNDIMNGLLKGF